MNYKYFSLKALLISSNLICMEHEFETPKNAQLNHLPAKLSQIIIENSFFAADQSLEEILDIINWRKWTKEEISIICGILKSKHAQKNTRQILDYLCSLQALCNSLEFDKENTETNFVLERQKLTMLKSLMIIVSSL